MLLVKSKRFFLKKKKNRCITVNVGEKTQLEVKLTIYFCLGVSLNFQISYDKNKKGGQK